MTALQFLETAAAAAAAALTHRCTNMTVISSCNQESARVFSQRQKAGAACISAFCPHEGAVRLRLLYKDFVQTVSHVAHL